MDFFETPPWDGDHGADKLTDELFRFRNVPLIKVSKKRKRNKYPKGSVIGENSKSTSYPKEGNISQGKSGKVKKNVTCDRGQIKNVQDHSLIPKEKKKSKEVLQQAKKDRVEPNDSHVEKINWSASQSGNKRDDLHSNSLPTLVNSTMPSKPPIKTKQKKKRKKNPALQGEVKNLKSGHNLKTLKDKLELNVKVKSQDKESNKGNSTRTSDQKPEKLANHSTEKQIHESSSYTIDSLQKKASINLISDQKHDKLLVPIKKKKRGNDAPSKKKIKTRDVTNHSQSIVASKIKQSPPFESRSNQSKSQKKNIIDDSNAKKLKKKKKKDIVKSCGDTGALVQDTSSHSQGIPSATMGKKRKFPEKDDADQKRVKKSRKFSNTPVDFDSLSNETLLSNPNMVPHQARELHHVDGTKTSVNSANTVVMTSPKKKLTLRERMMEKLRGARFRFLNEQMYSSKSQETRNFFQADRESFEAYHEGYKQQLLQWPLKPVDAIIKYLKKKPANYIIADFGCGDAQIAQSIPNEVHSFDHVALNGHVTVCDMAHTPLSNGSIDIAVFCLSLMGSNLSDYIYEANRVLKIGGVLKIAEVESRFDDVEKFIKVICKFGFLCIRRDLSKDVFYLFDFKKEKDLKEGKTLPLIQLRACSYKKR